MTTQLIIGIAGGSGSGKTTFAQELLRHFGTESAAFLSHDAYYRPLTHLSSADRAATNFDHPDAIETSLLVEHLEHLRQGRPVHVPEYDFAAHDRTHRPTLVQPRSTIIVEGIMILAEASLRAHFHVSVFIDAPADVRLQRRTDRDMQERGRSKESVLRQWEQTVHPMHQQYVEPSKQHAQLVVNNDHSQPLSIQPLLDFLQRM
ncbi:MAG: uridine kinase [Planctomycetales bacterium]|nr:uridine kinase [Planctomycetales bacterium]